MGCGELGGVTGTKSAAANSSSVICEWHGTMTGVRPKVLTAVRHSSFDRSSTKSGSVLIRQCSRAMRERRTASSRSLRLWTLSKSSACCRSLLLSSSISGAVVMSKHEEYGHGQS